MSEPTAAPNSPKNANPSDYSLTLFGLLMDVQQTQKGASILSVACGSTMYKVYTKDNGLKVMQSYRARLRGFQNGMFFEETRLPA